MKRLKPLTLLSPLRASLALAVALAYISSLALLVGADTRPASNSKGGNKTEKNSDKKPAKKKLTGAELYAIHCNRCHPERYPTEFTAAQWKTIMAEMRVRANLPAEQAKAILKYLQEDSGTP